MTKMRLTCKKDDLIFGGTYLDVIGEWYIGSVVEIETDIPNVRGKTRIVKDTKEDLAIVINGYPYWYFMFD